MPAGIENLQASWLIITESNNMRNKKFNILSVCILTIYMCGCSSTESVYFDSVDEAVDRNWSSEEFRSWPANVLLKELNNTMVLDGGGREADGVLTYYVREDDTYYQFDLSEQLSDHGQQSWQDAGAFRTPEDNTTILCWYDFDIDDTKTPDLAIVEFPTEHPEDYTAQFYALRSEDAFSIDVLHCYSLGDSVYVMWHDNQGRDRLSVIQQAKGQIQDCSEETTLLEQYAKEKSTVSYIGQYCVLLENNGVTVYSADVREAADRPPVSLVFMAIKDGKPLAGLYYDLTQNEMPKVVPEQFITHQ